MRRDTQRSPRHCALGVLLVLAAAPAPAAQGIAVKLMQHKEAELMAV